MVEKRGRKSLGDLSLVQMDPNSGRPEPPPDVVGREADIWRLTVDAMPRNWFGQETWSMLRGFCKHSFAAERHGEIYTAMLTQGPPAAGEGLAVYWDALHTLSDLYARETRSMGNMAVKLRITKQLRVERANAEVAVRNTAKRRMWEE